MFGDRLRLRVSSGFVLMAALVYFLDDSGIFAATVVYALVHELGHLMVLRMSGGHVTELRLELTGAAIYYNEAELSYFRELLTALAGPVSSVLFALVASRLGMELLAGVSLSLAAFNLLPCSALDGGRALYALLAAATNAHSASRVLRVVSITCSIGILLTGIYVLRVTGKNFSYILVALWLLHGTLRDET